MEDFLGDDLRDLAIAYQAEYLTDAKAPRSSAQGQACQKLVHSEGHSSVEARRPSHERADLGCQEHTVLQRQLRNASAEQRQDDAPQHSRPTRSNARSSKRSARRCYIQALRQRIVEMIGQQAAEANADASAGRAT